VPECSLFGVDGTAMREAGVDLLAEADLGVIGFAEVLRHLPALRTIQRRLERFFREEPPDLFIPVDYPGFNLRLCRRARNHGVPVMYYISPQVWAWGKGRIRKIARLVDCMVTILPFEESFYREAGVPVEFVGHPLVESLEEESDSSDSLLSSLGARRQDRRVGLLPGSRQSEVARIFPVMLRTAERIHRSIGDVRFLAAAWNEERARQLVDMARTFKPPLDIVTGQTRKLPWWLPARPHSRRPAWEPRWSYSTGCRGCRGSSDGPS